jgi:hypothetical protein
MTGALPAPPIIAHVETERPAPPPKRVVARKREPARAHVAKATPTPAARVAAPAVTSAPTPQRVKTVRKRARTATKNRHPVAATAREEFTFEGAGSTGGRPDASPARASASSLGASGGSGGGSQKRASSSGGSSGAEFNFEGGG